MCRYRKQSQNNMFIINVRGGCTVIFKMAMQNIMIKLIKTNFVSLLKLFTPVLLFLTGGILENIIFWFLVLPKDWRKVTANMKRALVCPVCGKEFVTDKNAKKYFSPKCRRKANSSGADSEAREFLCSWCGKSFVSLRRKKYCSNNCRMCANGKASKINKKISAPLLTLSQVAFLSRSAGLSYGQYVQKYQLK